MYQREYFLIFCMLTAGCLSLWPVLAVKAKTLSKAEILALEKQIAVKTFFQKGHLVNITADTVTIQVVESTATDAELDDGTLTKRIFQVAEGIQYQAKNGKKISLKRFQANDLIRFSLNTTQQVTTLVLLKPGHTISKQRTQQRPSAQPRLEGGVWRN